MSKLSMVGAWLLIMVVVASCGHGRPCTSATECGGGACLPAAEGDVRYCAGLDGSCPTGLRWDSSAGGGLDGQCVGLATGVDAPVVDSASSDAMPDGAPACTEGAVCAPTTDPCKLAGKCHAGVCAPVTDAADGASCGTASDACHTAPVCKAGACQPEGTHPTGYNFDAGNYLARCCGGVPTSINTPGNCGACGISCGGGQCVNNGATNGQQWWCTCSVSDLCWSGCCAGGSPSVCSPSTCGEPAHCTACPGGATCTESQNPHYWCHY